MHQQNMSLHMTWLETKRPFFNYFFCDDINRCKYP